MVPRAIDGREIHIMKIIMMLFVVPTTSSSLSPAPHLTPARFGSTVASKEATHT